MAELKLNYETSLGCEWLEEVHEVQGWREAQMVTEDYVKRNQARADRLTARWKSDGEGETAELSPMAWCTESLIETAAEEKLEELEG